MRTTFALSAAALALASASNSQEINGRDRFLSDTAKSSKTSNAKAKKKASTKSAKKKSPSGSAGALVGFWTGIDTFDGSTLRLSISCDDIATTNECEVIFSDDYWGPSYCGGMGVVIQNYTLSSSGSLTADNNGPILCADGTELTGYEDFNEYVLQSNGSLMWYIVYPHRFWPTSRV